jgi:PAS domain S-box-containing protein
MSETTSRKHFAEGLSAFFQDPIARKPVNEQLQFQATILQNVSESVIVTDLQGHIIYWNEGATALFGYSAQDMLGHTPAILYPETQTHQLHSDLEQIREGKDYIGEWKGRRKDGTAVWIGIRTTLLRTSEGAAIGFIGVAKDITERKQIEEELGKCAAIISSSDDAIVSKTLAGMITSWNQAAERLFGYSAEEAIGHHITLIIPPELHQEEEDIIRKLRQGIRIQHYETVRMRKDGTKVDVSLSISPVKDRAGNIIGAAKIARDITERRELERRKDEFISIASHELKTPITALKGFTHLLLRKFERQGVQEAVPILTKMEAQINRLAKLIDDLLDASKIQAGKLDYAKESIDIDALVHDIADTIQQISTTHTITIHGASHTHIVGDSDRLGQVFTNLISNAVKYSPQANQVDISLAASQNTVTVSVRDYGIGIPKEHQSKIFDRFYRVSDVHDKTFPGLGMGLYISSEVVKQHGGRLWVESTENQETTFFVSFPVA